jgi:hypothetical protein
VICRDKAPFDFYIVQYKFVIDFRHMSVGEDPKRINHKDEEFLKGKGIFIQEKNHTYIWLYGYQEKPFLLPIILYDIYFVMEVCRQYKSWCILFDRKRKKRFTTLPFKVGNKIIKNLSHLKEVSETLNVFNIK